MYYFPNLRLLSEKGLSSKTILLLSNSLGYIRGGEQEQFIKEGSKVIPSREYLKFNYWINKDSINNVKEELQSINITIHNNHAGYKLHYPCLTIKTNPFINYLSLFSIMGVDSHNKILYLSWLIYRDKDWYKHDRNFMENITGLSHSTQKRIEKELMDEGYLYENGIELNWEAITWQANMSMFSTIVWQWVKNHKTGQKSTDDSGNLVYFWTVIGLLLTGYRSAFDRVLIKNNINKKNYVLFINKLFEETKQKKIFDSHPPSKTNSQKPRRRIPYGSQIKASKEFPTVGKDASSPEPIDWLAVLDNIIVKGGFINMTIPEIKDLVNGVHRKKLEHGIHTRLSVERVSMLWKTLLSQYNYKHARNVMMKKERGIINTLIKSEIDVPAFLEYAIANWEILKRLNSNNNGKSRMVEYPDIMECYYAKDQILTLMNTPQTERPQIPILNITQNVQMYTKSKQKPLTDEEMIDMEHGLV